MAEAPLYGVLAEFESPEALMDAVRRTRAEGYRALDAFTPFPVEGLAELLEFRDGRVLWLGLIGGCLGFAVAFAMQAFVSFDYPLDVGGRPVYALSAFAVVAFELTVLFAALLPAFGMLVLNGLPRLNHPLFAASRFHLASKDRFFLCVEAKDPRFGRDETVRFLTAIGAQSVELVKA
jgi:Protein of unknown function (DUF3341)